MRINLFVVLVSLSRLDRESLYFLSIDQHFQFMWLVQALNLFVSIACQANLDFIFSVSWKRVTQQSAAARPQRQTLDLLFLRNIRPNAESIAARCAPGRADR